MSSKINDTDYKIQQAILFPICQLNTFSNMTTQNTLISDCKPITKASNFNLLGGKKSHQEDPSLSVPRCLKPLSVEKTILKQATSELKTHPRRTFIFNSVSSLNLCFDCRMWQYILFLRDFHLPLFLFLSYSPCLRPLGGIVVIIIISGDAKPCSDKQSVSWAGPHMNPAAVLTERAVPPVQASPLEA